MSEYIINDKWVLDRISNESTSFKDWLSDVIKTAKESVKDIDQKKANKIEQSDDLTDLVAIDNQISKAEEKVKKFDKKLRGLGSIGNFLSNIASSIGSTINDEIQKSSQLSPISDMGIDIDFLTGKRKSLSSALYDVAKERGIESEGILYLIESLPDLESFLYSTSAGKFYRDHTEHQLRVAVLGDFLLEQDLGNGTLLSQIADLSAIDKHLLKDKIWWLTGLIHDIGYPLQKMTKSINYSLLNQILKCYPMLDLDVSPFEISLSPKNIQPYLDFIEKGLSKEAIQLVRMGAGLNNKALPQPRVVHFPERKDGHIEYNYDSEVDLDHGVIGALSLLRSIGTPEEIKSNYDELEGYIKAAQAIALHNFKDSLKEYTFDTNPLAFLLVMIDEMQDWGRPIPLQIRDTYFTTEVKKITLLDEIQLLIDEVQWFMAYKKMGAKEISNFKFDLLCQSKMGAFNRLHRGNKFPKTQIIIQDYEVKTVADYDKEHNETASISESNVSRQKSDNYKTNLLKDQLLSLAKIDESKVVENLLAEFYIVI